MTSNVQANARSAAQQRSGNDLEFSPVAMDLDPTAPAVSPSKSSELATSTQSRFMLVSSAMQLSIPANVRRNTARVFNIETFDPVLRLFLTPGCEIVYMEELEPESDDDTRYLPKGPPTKPIATGAPVSSTKKQKNGLTTDLYGGRSNSKVSAAALGSAANGATAIGVQKAAPVRAMQQSPPEIITTKPRNQNQGSHIASGSGSKRTDTSVSSEGTKDTPETLHRRVWTPVMTETLAQFKERHRRLGLIRQKMMETPVREWKF